MDSRPSVIYTLYQLKNYLEYNLKLCGLYLQIYFSENRKKLEKRLKVKGKYKKRKNMVLQVVKPVLSHLQNAQE